MSFHPHNKNLALSILEESGHNRHSASIWLEDKAIKKAVSESGLEVDKWVEQAIQSGAISPPPDMDGEAPGEDYHDEGATTASGDDVQPPGGDFDYKQISPVYNEDNLAKRLIWKKAPVIRGDVVVDAGKLKPNSLHNILVHLRHDQRYHGLFRYDRFAGRVVLHKEPFWWGKEPFKIRKRIDTDVDYIEAAMDMDGLDPSNTKVRSAIDVVSRENWINPPLEYFENLTWDGRPRLRTWLQYYLGAEGDEDYLQAVGMAWLIAGAARIYEPGCKAENMLVLEGEQGLLKSTALSVMANVGHGKDEESYFCDTLTFSKIQEKDTVAISQGKLIIEFAELASLGNREIEEVKGWMSIQCDEIRKPYGHDVEKFPRQFILAGSTNESLWLKDQTGNRRFWPVKCGKIDIPALMNDRSQLWAEAVHMYKNKADWWINKTSPIWIKATEEQDLRLLEDVWAAPIEQYVLGNNFVTVQEILTHFKIDIKDQNKQQQARVIGVLKRLGYIPKQMRHTGKNVRGWAKPGTEYTPEPMMEIPID